MFLICEPDHYALSLYIKSRFYIIMHIEYVKMNILNIL